MTCDCVCCVVRALKSAASSRESAIAQRPALIRRCRCLAAAPPSSWSPRPDLRRRLTTTSRWCRRASPRRRRAAAPARQSRGRTRWLFSTTRQLGQRAPQRSATRSLIECASDFSIFSQNSLGCCCGCGASSRLRRRVTRQTTTTTTMQQSKAAPPPPIA